MDHHLFHIWWLIFPLIVLIFGAGGMWLRYQRQRDTLELLRTYAAQGKDPPADLVKVLHGGGRLRGAHREWQRAIMFGAIAIGLGVVAYSRHGIGPTSGLTVAAIVLGALAVNAAISAVLLRKADEK